MAGKDASPPRSRTRRRLRRLAIGGASGLVSFAVLGFLVAPPIARHVAQKQLGELLGRKVTIGRIRINPFALSLTVEDFRVYEADQVTPFVGFSRLYVNAQLSSVFRRAPVLKEIALRLAAPARRAHEGDRRSLGRRRRRLQLLGHRRAAAARPKSPEPPAPPDAPPPRFSLNNIHISDAGGHLRRSPTGDTTRSPSSPSACRSSRRCRSTSIRSSSRGSASAIDGTPFAIKGRTKPFKDSLETVLELRLNALDLTRYVPFVPVRLPFSVDSARLSLALDVDVRATAGGRAQG